MNTTIEKEIFDIIGDNHQMTSVETPLRPDAFFKSDAEKMEVIEHHFEIIMKDLCIRPIRRNHEYYLIAFITRYNNM